MKNKVVVITGASSGIGKALVLHYAQRGANVVMAARNVAALHELEQELLAKKQQVHAVATDVTKATDCQRLIDETIARFGQIDVLICNAGISMRGLFLKTEMSVLEQLMQVNFWGTVYCCKAALPYLLQARGSIVGVSSIAGKVGLPARTGYSASKFAMEGFLQTLRTENLHKGLHVMVACPGFTASNIRNVALTHDGSTQKESPRDEKTMMSAEKVAEYIYEGQQIRRRDLVLTGQGRLTVFLSKFFPGLLDRMVFRTMAKEPDSPLNE